MHLQDANEDILDKDDDKVSVDKNMKDYVPDFLGRL